MERRTEKKKKKQTTFGQIEIQLAEAAIKSPRRNYQKQASKQIRIFEAKHRTQTNRNQTGTNGMPSIGRKEKARKVWPTKGRRSCKIGRRMRSEQAGARASRLIFSFFPLYLFISVFCRQIQLIKDIIRILNSIKKIS